MPGACIRRRSLFLSFLLIVVPGVLVYQNTSYLSGISTYLSKELYHGYRFNHTAAISTHDGGDFLDLGAEPEEKEDLGRLCRPDECMQGSWIPRTPPFRNFADFRRVYPPSRRGIFKICGSEENKREPEDREMFHRAQQERLLHVANWVWKPSKGRMRKWDVSEFVVRLLRSPGGLIFSGDSITRQQFQWFEYALARADISIQEDPKHLPFHSHRRLHQFILKPDDPMTAYLQDRAGVPDSRLLRPIYTKIDNHILVGEKEIREYSVPLGAKETFPWYDHFDYFEGWEEFVSEMAKEKGEHGVTEDTVLVLNTGAHWSRGALYMLPNTGGSTEQQSRVTALLQKVIEHVISKLNGIPKLQIYYRSTSPGHPACSSAKFYKSFGMDSAIIAQPDDDESSKRFVDVPTFHTSPYSDVDAAHDAMSNITRAVQVATPDQHMKLVQSRWDWDRFEANNVEWKKAINALNHTDENSSARPKWYYMDVWNMTLQRPDAHTQTLDSHHGSYDCLHWCVPGIVEQWMEYLGHLVLFD